MENSVTETVPSPRKKKNRPAFICFLIGCLLLIFNLVIALPIYVPRAFGYTVFFITTGSMDPVIPTDSITYFKRVDPATLNVGDVIAYTGNDGIVIVHRVAVNNTEKQYILAKGDNNRLRDHDQIPYERVHGLYITFIPGIGPLMYFMHSIAGKILMITIAAIGSALIIISLVLRRRKPRE